MTAAPASSAMRIAGADARIRVSSATSEPFRGTFMSQRIKTRLPDSWPALANALSVWTPAIVLARLHHSGCGIEHTAGEAPLVVIPCRHFDQRTVDASQCGIVGGRYCGVVEVTGNQGVFIESQHAFE